MYVTEVRSVVSQTKRWRQRCDIVVEWGKAHIRPDINCNKYCLKKARLQGHISSTLFRKSAVTAVHTKHKDMKGQLADLMAQKEATAQRYYKLHEKQQSCIQAAAELPSIMRTVSTTNKVSEEGTSMTKVEDANPASTEGSKEKQIMWNAQQMAAIRELFREEISQKSVKMQEVRNKIKDHLIPHDQDTKMSATEFIVNGVVSKMKTTWRLLLPLNSQKNKKLYWTYLVLQNLSHKEAFWSNFL